MWIVECRIVVDVVNSSTLCCTERRPGNVDATFSLVDQDNYIQFGKDDIYIIYAYVTATLYWEIACMRIVTGKQIGRAHV